MLLKFSILLFSLVLCKAQEYEEYRPEPRSFNSANRYVQAETEQKAAAAAPVAILKQINRHNEDGSYTYGYEAADGSFKIETKAANGEVKGKYGYFDGERVRVVEYGADRHGFQPSGEGITVPPPTFHDDRAEEQEYEQEPPRQYTVAAKPKFQKPPAVPVQAYKFVPEQQQQPQPAIAQPLQYQYDYEEEITTTQRPLPVPSRPKFAAPAFQFSPSQPARPQFPNSIPIDIIYADAPKHQPTQPSAPFKSQFQNLADRRPPQFPPQEEQEENVQPTLAPIVAANRADQFTLFSPVADSRGDIYKPKSLPLAPAPQQKPSFPSFNAPRESYQFAPQSPPSRPVFSAKPLQQRTTSILDQLAKDYALPKSSAPALHDISFGYNV